FSRHARRVPGCSGRFRRHPSAVRRGYERQRRATDETSRADGAILRRISDAENVAARRHLIAHRLTRRLTRLGGLPPTRVRTRCVAAYTEVMRRLHLIFVPLCAASILAQTASSPVVERVGDTGFLQLQAESFNALDARQKELAYWLTQASIAIDPIVYD